MNLQKLTKKPKSVTDPRRQWGNRRHQLEDRLVIGFCAIVCDGEDFTDMENQEWLRIFLAFPNGIPDSETFRRVFEKVKPQKLSNILRDWLDYHREKRSVVRIDGKTICGRGGRGHKAYLAVSAFVRENRITLGERKTEEKSNEITAVPKLLEMLDLKGAIVTADAMRCQIKIAADITDKEADSVIGLKGNQSNLLEDRKVFFERMLLARSKIALLST